MLPNNRQLIFDPTLGKAVAQRIFSALQFANLSAPPSVLNIFEFECIILLFVDSLLDTRITYNKEY